MLTVTHIIHIHFDIMVPCQYFEDQFHDKQDERIAKNCYIYILAGKKKTQSIPLVLSYDVQNIYHKWRYDTHRCVCQHLCIYKRAVKHRSFAVIIH